MTEYTCTLDHDGWQLYDMPGVKAVAADLSGTLTATVRTAKAELKANPMANDESAARWTFNEVYKSLVAASKFGAADTEPRNVLYTEIETAFGLDPYALVD